MADEILSSDPNAGSDVISEDPNAGTFTARATGYHPFSPDSPQYSMEGGFEGADSWHGKKLSQKEKLYTLDQYRRGQAPYVSLAMDNTTENPFPYGTMLASPDMPGVKFRVMDTGAAFRRRGTERVDIARDTESGANSDENNRNLRFYQPFDTGKAIREEIGRTPERKLLAGQPTQAALQPQVGEILSDDPRAGLEEPARTGREPDKPITFMDWVGKTFQRSQTNDELAKQLGTTSWNLDQRIVENAGEAAKEVGMGFIPKSGSDVAKLLTYTPLYDVPKPLLTEYKAVREWIAGGHKFDNDTLEKLERKYHPESFALSDADKTPAFSKERFQAGFQVLAQMLQAAGITKGMTLKPKGEIPNASERSNAQVQTGDAAQREQTRPESEVPPTSDSDKNERGTSGTARGTSQETEEIPEDEVSGVEQPTSPNEPQPSRITSIKNEQVDQERQQRGLPPMLKTIATTHPEVWNAAMADVERSMIDRQPHPADVLIEEMKAKPRALTAKEDFHLLHRQVELQNEFDKVSQALTEAAGKTDPESVASIAENTIRSADLLDKLQEVYATGQIGGTETARGLAFRKALVAEDFSLAAMINKKRALRGGRQLTPEELDNVKIAHRDISARQISLDAYETSSRAEAYRKRLRALADEYAKRTAAGDFAVKRPKPIELDPDLMARRAALQAEKEKWQNGLREDQMANASRPEKIARGVLKWRRNFVISGVRSLAKLGAAAIEGSILLPLRQAIGGGLGKLPVLKSIYEKAPTEGRFHLKTEANAIADTFKYLLSDFVKNVKGKKPDYEQVYGPYRNVPVELNNYVGLVHSAIKSPLARNVWSRDLSYRLEFAARHGVDISDPLVQMELGRQSWEKTQFWKFQNKNLASQVYRGILRNLETTKLPGAKGIGKVASFALQAEMPIVVVPSNLIARTFEGVFGGVTGMARVGVALAKGIRNLTPAQSDLIARNINTGALGTAVMLIGLFNPQMFGGFYRRGKKDPSQPGFGAMKIGDTEIPAWLMDNPFLIEAQFGATIRQVGDSYLRKTDTQTAGYWVGTWSAITGAVENQPFVREATDLPRAFSASTVDDFLGEHARSYVIPMAVQQIAQWTDQEDKRYPRGFAEQLMVGIPGLREGVSATDPRSRPPLDPNRIPSINRWKSRESHKGIRPRHSTQKPIYIQ